MNNFLRKIKAIKADIEEVLSKKTKLWSSDRLALAIIPGTLLTVFIVVERIDMVWKFFLCMVGGIVIVYLFFTLLICIPLIKKRLNNIF